MKALHAIAMVLVLVGALNWGLVSVARFDLVAFVAGLGFGETSAFSRLIYGLVGLASIFEIGLWVAARRRHARPAVAG